jgi:hypothetical protein
MSDKKGIDEVRLDELFSLPLLTSPTSGGMTEELVRRCRSAFYPKGIKGATE